MFRSSGENESASLLTITSLNGFLGNVSLSASAPSAVGVIVADSSVLLGSSATVSMALAASSLGDYTVTIVGSSGSLTHSIILIVHSRDVSVQTTQQSFSIQQGSSVTAQLSFQGLNSFAGNLILSETPAPIGPSYIPDGRWFINGTLSSRSIQVNSGSVSTATLTISAGDFAWSGNYTFTVRIAYNGWTWNIPFLARVTYAPEPALNLVAYTFNSNTNATLIIHNAGPATIEITGTSASNSTGASEGFCLSYPHGLQCLEAIFIDPGGYGAINFLSDGICASCYATPFTYKTGQTYTFRVTTSRQNSFTYTITR